MFAIVATFTSKPKAFASSSACLACFTELSSLDVYKIPTVFNVGTTCFIISNCCLIGVRSLTPVMLFPGFFSSLINPASTG